MQANFDKKAFDANFDQAIETITSSEKVTKTILRELSRSVLQVLFFTEDIGYVNRTINSLSPVNKKVAIEYFKTFSGFSFSKDSGAFGKKNKKVFEQVKGEAMEFLSDPHNNIWTWAEQNVDIVAKPFDINAVGTYFSKALTKAAKAGFTDVDVIMQVFSSGIDIAAVQQAMQKLAESENKQIVVDGIVEVSADE